MYSYDWVVNCEKASEIRRITKDQSVHEKGEQKLVLQNKTQLCLKARLIQEYLTSAGLLYKREAEM